MNKTKPTLAIINLLTAGSLALAADKGDLSKIDVSKLPPPAAQKGVTYEKDIKPILEASCFRCHGDERPKGGLRLNSLESALKGGEDGKVITPGKSKESLLVIAAAQIDDETAMPPKRGPGGPGGRGGPGGPGGRGGFGPGMMIAPQMISQADKSGDKKLTKDEFVALADVWFEKLDTEKAGKLGQDQFVERLPEVLPPPQGFGGPGGPPGGGQVGQRPGGGRGFGPARFAGPAIFAAADTDKDGSLTRAELKNTFAKWYTNWDTDKSDALDETKIRDGLNAALPRPNFGGPGGPGGRSFGGPGGSGGQGGPGGPGGGRGPGGPGGQGGPGGPGGFGGPGGGGFGPPPKPLTTEQVSLLRAWIDQGAK